MQVKHARSDGQILTVRCSSSSLTNGKVRAVKRYTAATIDLLATYDATTERVHYVPAKELGEGRATITLRVAPTANNQVRGCLLYNLTLPTIYSV